MPSSARATAVVWGQPVDENGAERVVVAGQQHPFPSANRSAGLGNGEKGLPAADAAGDKHARVDVERLEPNHPLRGRFRLPVVLPTGDDAAGARIDGSI
jgi:hypothetical protein